MARAHVFVHFKNILYLQNSSKLFSVLSSIHRRAILLNNVELHHKLNNGSIYKLSSLPNVEDGKIQPLEEFLEPRKVLSKLINKAYATYQNPHIRPKISEKQIDADNQRMWHVSITLTWPEKAVVEGTAAKRSAAENIAFLNACKKMKLYGLLDSKNNPVLPTDGAAFGIGIINRSKGSLANVYQRIWAKTGNKDYIPKFDSFKMESIFGAESVWKCRLRVTFPEENIFEGTSDRVREAEGIAAANCLQWLIEKRIINTKGRLINYSVEDEIRLKKYHSAPHSLSIPIDLQHKMRSVIQHCESLHLDELIDRLNEQDVTNDKPGDNRISNIITEKSYQELSEEDMLKRSREMFEQNVAFSENSDSHINELKSFYFKLPIKLKRANILNLLDENQVIILSGETGCGKTTQVPQYILDDYINRMQGAKCNIVVTQPRRISAISIAERVAYERNEKIGETIGYQVRLKKCLPQKSGAILFCSTGMLLRKLCSNPDLKGISHVIVDEIHERSIQIDFLLILLKRLIETNKNIKIIMMSASFNTSIFSQYFDNCPVIHVPGKMHPVEEFFLENLKDDIPNINIESKLPILNTTLVSNVINRIHETQELGGILCFLPGWHDIVSVQNQILNTCNDPSELVICCAHSQLSHHTQKKIFDIPQPGIRKIVLATNIAETSITINDIVYVVNSGLHKATSFDDERGVASLGTHWITKANVRQRRGRAGRVRPGMCFNLFSRKVFMEMDDYPIPELQRMPLENVILDCKLYCPESKAEEFLSLALQPPSRSSLQCGVQELQVSGILDQDENLTNLGEIVVKFATHPRLSLALIYASFLRCMNPVLNVCAILTHGKEPFVNRLNENAIFSSIKRCYDNFLRSDHLALSNIYDIWESTSHEPNFHLFVSENLLDEQNLKFIKDLKGLFVEDLHKVNIVKDKSSFSSSKENCNSNMKHAPSIFTALASAFFPNLIKVIQGELSHVKLNKDAIVYSLIKGQHGYIQKESVASDEYELPSPWLTYFSALQSESRRLMMTSNVSAVPGICLLMFIGKYLHIKNYDNEAETAILAIDEYKKLTFSCSQSEAELLQTWRKCLKNLFTIYIHSLKSDSHECENIMKLYDREFLPILKELLDTPQVPFTKGQCYKFVNNELISEDLWDDRAKC